MPVLSFRDKGKREQHDHSILNSKEVLHFSLFGFPFKLDTLYSLECEIALVSFFEFAAALVSM